MSDPLDPKSVLEAAQEAAGAGDYEAAERLLRDAAALQEASLGPVHPELATTLNNLALVCERTGKLDEAERGYRRAHAIAVASLTPGHPFVATSLKNLLDFCAARGIPVWTPPAIEPGAETSSSTLATRHRPELAFKSEVPEEPASEKRDIRPRVVAITALSVSALVAVFLIMQGRGAGDSSTPSPAAQQVSPPSGSRAPSPTTPASSPQPEPTPTPTPETSRQTPIPVERSRPGTATTPAPVTVLNAQLCSALNREGSPDWQCTPVSGSSQPGTFIFYTRLLTDLDTTVEHRWYRDGRLHQRMPLRVRANQNSGYRTYSSNTVSPKRAGDWKVELRAADGTLLREEQFVIR